ncbi:MAG: hypothetical protein IPL76_11125 [Gemmatimonadetes bacterium]|nr:hypothetical protein [Gemmatimonadota bacterium]
MAELLAVADVCEALSAEQPYRKALPQDEVTAIMEDGGDGAVPGGVRDLTGTETWPVG